MAAVVYDLLLSPVLKLKRAEPMHGRHAQTASLPRLLSRYMHVLQACQPLPYFLVDCLAACLNHLNHL